MTATNRKSGLRPLRILLAAVAGLALATGSGWSPVDRVLVWHWRVRLLVSDDSRAARIVEQISAQGEVGLEALAALLGSARTSVVEAARRSIRHEIDQWPQLEATARQGRALRLAQALDAQVEQFSPASRRVASDFAARILREANPPRGPQRQDLVAACEHVLRTSILTRRKVLLAADDRGATQGDDIGQRTQDELAGEPLVDRWGSHPGGGLPIDSIQVPSIPVETGKPSDDNANESADGRTGQLAAGEPGRLAAEAAANEGALPIAQSSDDDPRLLPTETTGKAADASPGADPTDTLRWMHALHSGDLALRARAEEELERQGFQALQLELARQLTDPDPRIRRALAESLPAMPGIDAHVWLVWLSRDENADVRLAAMTVMATTADPNVIRRIEQMARTDADPRIQRQGERLLGLRDSDRQATGGRRVAR